MSLKYSIYAYGTHTGISRMYYAFQKVSRVVPKKSRISEDRSTLRGADPNAMLSRSMAKGWPRRWGGGGAVYVELDGAGISVVIFLGIDTMNLFHTILSSLILEAQGVSNEPCTYCKPVCSR